MSTVPQGDLLEERPLAGDAAILAAGLAPLAEELIAAKRENAELEIKRNEAAKFLCDIDGQFGRSKRRIENAQRELDAYLNARVENPIP